VQQGKLGVKTGEVSILIPRRWSRRKSGRGIDVFFGN